MKREKEGLSIVRYIIAIILILFSFVKKDIYCQFFEWGQDPASIRWHQLNTENFKIIFPSEIKDNALKMSCLLEESYLQNAFQLQHKASKIPVVMHNQSVESNGFVGIAPKRMEIFIQPDPGNYPGEWLQQLAIHEQRHVTQIAKVNQGFTRFLSCFLGEQANGYGAALLPFWLLEGDAVYAETSLSNTGRGRLPAFEKELKAILTFKPEGYSHEKSYLGSYKNFIPDYYKYGFQLVSYGSKIYGENFWPEAIKFTGRNSWMFSPLSYYFKKETGLNRSKFHYETMGYLKSYWKKSALERTIIEYDILNKPYKTYSSYKYPHLQNDNSIIAVKTGLDIIPCFIKINPDGSESHLFTPGILNSGRISVKNNKILWDEYRADLRWTNRSFSILREYNLDTKSVRSLSFNSRYSSPSYSPGTDTIIAIEVNPLQETFLVMISALDGKLIEKIPSPGNLFLQSPEWLTKSGAIAAIALNESGKTIVLYDHKTKKWSELLYTGFFDIQDLSSQDDYLIFQASFKGIDDIYALNIYNNTIYRITYSEFGAYYPSALSDGSILAFSIYTKDGYKLSKIPFNPSGWEMMNIDSLVSNEQAFFNTEKIDIENKKNINIPENYMPEIKKYSKLSSLFRFHSWLPFYIDYNNFSLESSGLGPGFSLTSQNILSTALTSLGYEYNNKEHIFHTTFIYKGLLPVFSFSADYGGKASSIPADTSQLISNETKYLFYKFRTFIPLKFSSGKIITGVQPVLTLNYSGNYYYYYESDRAYHKGIFFIEPRLYIYSYRRMAYRDLQPEYGFILDGKTLSAPFEKEMYGSLSSLKSVIYLPGILRNQGIKLQYQTQIQETEKYLMANHILFPRGYKNLTTVKLSKYSADYIFPLIYPDINLGSFIYLKRIYVTAFGDYMKGKGVYEKIGNNTMAYDKNIYSIGTEINFEYHLFRFLFPFIQGVRASYVSEKKKMVYESIFSIDINRF